VTPVRLVLADTDPLYAAFDPSDGSHARARTEMDALLRSSISVVVASTTLIEAHKLLLHRFSVQTVMTWLERITISVEIVYPTEEDLASAVAIVRRYGDQPLALYDTTVAAMSSRLQLPIWTYDFHFDILRANRWYPE
jgi:uncharacterized protein